METTPVTQAAMAYDVPLVSVVVPTFNRMQLLSETLDSILNQNFRYFEIIIVDNMSEDGTEAYVKGLDDPRIRYFRNANNGIIAVNRNYGIRQARGIYVAFCDDDDIWLPEKLQKQVSFMEQNPAIGLTFGYAENFGESAFNGLLLYAKKESDRIDSFEKLLLGNKIATFTVMLQKECLEDVGCFDEDPDFKAIEDYDLWLRIALKYRIECVPEILGKYRVHTGCLSSNKVLERTKLFRILNKFILTNCIDIKLARKTESRICWMIGNALLYEYDAKYRSWYFNSFKKNINMRTLLALAFCLMPIVMARKLFIAIEKIKITHQHSVASSANTWWLRLMSKSRN
jgi:glycosyltransferase involved in cell wall biosynthesis